MGAGLSKSERLNKTKAIDDLFARGESLLKYPLRCVFLANEEGESRIIASVSKKRFKRAVKRNRVKRLIRESYRLNKGLMGDGVAADVAFICVADELPTFQMVEKSMVALLQQIGERINVR